MSQTESAEPEDEIVDGLLAEIDEWEADDNDSSTDVMGTTVADELQAAVDTSTADMSEVVEATGVVRRMLTES